jgi:hypothetical protein
LLLQSVWWCWEGERATGDSHFIDARTASRVLIEKQTHSVSSPVVAGATDRPTGAGQGFLFIAIFAYQLLHIWWGIDFSDTGFNATFFQQIFDEPASVQYNFPYWLTGVIGGLWVAVFGTLGLLGIRLLGILLFTGMVMLVHALLKPHFGGPHLRAGLACEVLLLGPTTAFFGLEYNLLTALCFTLGSLLIFRGLTHNSRGSLFAAGVVLGLNVFVRLPNVVYVAMIAPALYFGWSRRRPLRDAITPAGIILLGFVVAVCAVLLLMRAVGHFDLYIDSLRRLRDLAASGQSHGLMVMVKTMATQYLTLAGVLVATLAFVWTYAMVARRAWRVAVGFLAVAGLWLFMSMYAQNDFLTLNLVYVAIALVTLVCAQALLDPASNPEVKFLFLLALMQVALSPLGSDHGFINQRGFAIVIGLPAAIAYVLNRDSYGLVPSWLRDVARDARTRFRAKQSLVIAAMAVSLLAGWVFTYCEGRWKHTLVFPIRSPLAPFIFSSRERATAVNELLAESARYVGENDYALAYDEMPMFYYLTRTRPFLYGLWPKLFDDEVFRQTLEASFSEKRILPVIIRQRVSTWGNWPAEVPADYDRISNGRNRYLREFQQRHGYSLAWENKAFQIWVPGQRDR